MIQSACAGIFIRNFRSTLTYLNAVFYVPNLQKSGETIFKYLNRVYGENKHILEWIKNKMKSIQYVKIKNGYYTQKKKKCSYTILVWIIYNENMNYQYK